MNGSSDTVHGLVATSATRDGSAAAIGAPGRAFLTFDGLRALITRTIARLNELGIGRGDRVAVVLANGPEMATAFLSISSATTCAPLNPGYRAAEFAFYLEDLRPAALVVRRGVDSPARGVAAKLGVRVLELDVPGGAEAGVFELAGEAREGSAGTGPAHADDIAMVLHTSGTTSRPKIVPLRHRNLAASAGNIGATLRLTPADRCLNVMPLYHIHGLMSATLASMAAGASVVCSPGFDAAKFFAWLSEAEPSWYTAVPTIHQAVLGVAAQHADVVAASRLRFARSSSAALPAAVKEGLEALLRCPVIEAYGMTEASHQMTSNPLPPGVRKVGSVGLPTGIDVAILDAAGAELPANARGEIAIAGPSVIDGYENNPAANASSFTGKWFRTGDQGYRDEDGYVFISGRLKEIINKAGEKISPREIDDVLLRHPAIEQVVTFAMPHPTLGEDVAAAVVLRKGHVAEECAIRRFAAESLAEFKLPQRVLFVDALPKGPTGKLKRIGLADDFAEALAARIVEEAETPTERALAEVWRVELKQERVGRRDNYFVLGGDSLQAVMVVLRAKAAGLTFTPNDLFTHPTVAELAAWIDGNASDGARGAEVKPDAPAQADATLLLAVRERAGLPADRVAAVYGLTAFQRAIVASYEPRLSPAAIQTAWTLAGADVGTLRAAIQRVVDREPTLRTGFVKLEDGSFRQFVVDRADVEIVEHDLRGLALDAQEARLRELALEHHERPFELAKPPLVRALIARLGHPAGGSAALDHPGGDGGSVRYVCTWQHAICDIWSIGLIERAIAAAYDAIAGGHALPSPAAPSFERFVAWREASARPETLAFWSRELAGLPENELTRFFRGKDGKFMLPSPARGVVAVALPDARVAAISAWCRAAAVTPSTLYHGAWALAQSRYAAADDILFGAVVSGRWGDLEGLEGVVGPTTAAAPLRVRVRPDEPFVAWLQALQGQLAALQAHADTPWDAIARALAPPRRMLPSWSSLVVENLPDHLWERPSERLTFSDYHHRTHMRTPLLVSVFPVPHPHLKATFDAAFFTSEDASALLRGMADVLVAVTEGPPATVGATRAAAGVAPRG